MTRPLDRPRTSTVTQSRGARKPAPNWTADTRFITRAARFGRPDRYIQRTRRDHAIPRGLVEALTIGPFRRLRPDPLPPGLERSGPSALCAAGRSARTVHRSCEDLAWPGAGSSACAGTNAVG